MPLDFQNTRTRSVRFRASCVAFLVATMQFHPFVISFLLSIFSTLKSCISHWFSYRASVACLKTKTRNEDWQSNSNAWRNSFKNPITLSCWLELEYPPVQAFQTFAAPTVYGRQSHNENEREAKLLPLVLVTLHKLSRPWRIEPFSSLWSLVKYSIVLHKM